MSVSAAANEGCSQCEEYEITISDLRSEITSLESRVSELEAAIRTALADTRANLREAGVSMDVLDRIL